MPSYYPEGDTPLPTDSIERLLAKAVSTIGASGDLMPLPSDSQEQLAYKLAARLQNVGASSTLSTQAEAEDGSDNTKWMTPLRTAQAMEARLGKYFFLATCDGKARQDFPQSTLGVLSWVVSEDEHEGFEIVATDIEEGVVLRSYATEYTIPEGAGGLWQFGVQVFMWCATPGVLMVTVYKNSSQIGRMHALSMGDSAQTCFPTTCRVAAGDVISVSCTVWGASGYIYYDEGVSVFTGYKI